MATLHLDEVLKQLSSCIPFIALKYNSLEIYRNALELFLAQIRILHWHKRDKKYLRAPALGEIKLSCVQVSEKPLVPVRSLLPSPATISSPFSIRALLGPLAEAADVTLACSRRRA